MTDAHFDPELVAKASSGDRVALHRLLLEYYDPLVKHIAARIPSKFQSGVSAEDVVQQTFLQVMRHIGRFSPKTDHSFHAWLKRIAENRLTDTIRHLACEKRAERPRPNPGSTSPEESSLRGLVESLSAGSHTPSGSAARHEAVAAVQEAIEALPDDYRQAVELRLFAGRSLAETAAVMRRSPRAVQGLIDRAKKKMRAALGRLSLYE